MGMRARIVRIGNSRGIRLPKALLEECHLGDAVELSVEDGALVIRPLRRPRESWEQAFQAMAEAGDDALLDPEAPTGTAWDEAEWDWPEA
jgi:antitoxin MazE